MRENDVADVQKLLQVIKRLKELERVVTVYLEYAEFQASPYNSYVNVRSDAKSRCFLVIQRIPIIKICRESKPRCSN